MSNAQIKDCSLELKQFTFSLTPLQRAFNPLSNLFVLLIDGALWGCVFLIIGGLAGFLFSQSMSLLWIVLGATTFLVFAFLLFQWPATSFFRQLSKDSYINMIELDQDFVHYGVSSMKNREFYRIPIKVTKVRRGVFNVSILSRHEIISDVSIVIPNAVISFENLSRYITK